MEWAAYLGIGALVGFAAGLLGIGGGVVMVPLLVLVFGAHGMPPQPRMQTPDTPGQDLPVDPRGVQMSFIAVEVSMDRRAPLAQPFGLRRRIQDSSAELPLRHREDPVNTHEIVE